MNIIARKFRGVINRSKKVCYQGGDTLQRWFSKETIMVIGDSHYRVF